jgi:hypothetical protein
VLDLLSNPTFSGNTFDANGITAVGIIGGNLAQDATLPVRNVAGYSNITYVWDSNLTVQFGATLTIEPGIVIKGWYSIPYYIGHYVNVQGALVADGDSLNPIVFTSVADDSYGNPPDTNNDGSLTVPAAAQWSRFDFSDVSTDSVCLLDHCIIRYGGRDGYGQMRTVSAAPTFSKCTFEYGYYYGLRLDGVSEPVVEDCDFVGHGRTPITMTLLSDPVTSGNEFIGNGYTAIGIIGETLAQDVTWTRRNIGQLENIPYVLLNNLTVGTGATLTLEPGLIVKPLTGVGINVRRGFIAEGKADPESLIVFTSTADDFYGGDTNGDSTDTDGYDSRWGSIDVQSTALSANVRFENCVFSYSYNSDAYGAVIVKGSVSPTFERCTFAHNRVGINYQEASGDSLIGKVDSCDFFDNYSYAIKNTGMAHTVWAEDCWWGHDSGPYDPSDDTGSGGLYNPAGQGDRVTDKVNYTPWGTSGAQNYLLGDVSLNGEIHAWDASLILQGIVGYILLTPQQEVIGDVNCSGLLSALDASYILRYVAGLISFFPCTGKSIPTFAALPFDTWPAVELGEFRVDLDDFVLEPGTEVVLPVRLSGTGEIFAARFEIESSSENVRIAEIAETGAAGGTLAFSKIGADGVARLALAATEQLPVATLATVRIAIDEAISLDEEVIISFRHAVINEQDLTLEATPARGLASGQLPHAFALEQNTPNPFCSGTTIRFAIPAITGSAIPTKLNIYDAAGRLVRTLVDEPRSPGIHEIYWNGRDERGIVVGSGVYFGRLDAGAFSAQRKMVFLR